MAVIVRPATPEEIEAVRSMWAASYRDAAHVTPQSYDRWITKRTARLTRRGTVLVCEDNGVIVGWSVGEAPDVVHYTYVKVYARRIGTARKLLRALAGHLERPIAEYLAQDGTWSARPRDDVWTYTHRRPPYTLGLEDAGWVYAPRRAR
jgi:L-amino acid N-acyltransferase YncA